MDTKYDISKVRRTRITSVKDLKEGDVLPVYWVKGRDKNKNPPACNFRGVNVVTSIRELDSGEWVFNHKKPEFLKSNNGDHEPIQACLSWSAPLDVRLNSSTFGCNHRITEGYIVFRLDSISSFSPTCRAINLKGNPAYDLMM